MMRSVDVIINVYGKPYQTIVTLKTLLKYSGSHIDKIYLIEEPRQPHFFDIKAIISAFPNIIHYKPQYYNSVNKTQKKLFEDNSYRLSLRYQYGIEKSDKKFVFITHNDVLYKDDIVGHMLENIGTNIGIGQIGQCWNCPMFFADKCNGDKFEDFDYSIEEIRQVFTQFKPKRKMNLDQTTPFPLSECRLNEWFCLLNNEINKEETVFKKRVVPFGTYINETDLAVVWFREMYLKGFTFKNIDTNKWATHAYFSFNGNGHSSLSDLSKYSSEENSAKEYLKNNFNFQGEIDTINLQRINQILKNFKIDSFNLIRKIKGKLLVLAI